MSTIKIKPYIETKLALLNATQLGLIETALNNQGTITNARFGNVPVLNITTVNWTFTNKEIKPAILINTENVKLLLCYNLQYQDVAIYELDFTNYKEKLINEYCDINELRRIIAVYGDHQESAWEQALKPHLYYENDDVKVDSHFSVYAEDESRMVDVNNTNKTTSLYGDVKIGSEETPTDLTVNGDATIDNVIANDEIEFTDENGDFGTNAKARIQEKIEESVPDSMGHVGKFLQHISTGNSWEPVQANDIATMTGDNGKVLTANGEGGATWENAPTTPVIDNTTSTSTTSALSANMGKVLNDRINYVEARGRFLSVWNATTGQPNDLPTDIATTTYTYRTGDYFIVGVGGNKVPTGTTVPAGTTTATFPSTTGGTSVANDTIVFNGATWDLIHTNIPTVTFGSITGNVSDNTPLTNAFNGKQDTITTTNKLSASLVSGLANVATSGSYNDLSNKPTIPTVNDATLTIQKNGTTVDTFTANSSTNKTVNITVPTNNNELTNGAGYITNSYHDSTKLDATKCTFQTTAPTGEISDGGVHIVYLSAEPTTKYSGYIYLIAE